MAVVVEMDANLAMTTVNDEFAERVMAKKAAIDASFLDLFEEEADKQRVRHALSRSAAAAGGMVKVDGLRCVAYGTGSNDFPCTVSYDWTLLVHNDGFIGIASKQERDTTHTASLEEIQELKDFFNKAPIALHWLGSNGKVLWANDRELEVLGYSREEYIGEDIMNFCPDSEQDVLEIFKELGSGNTIRDVPIRFRTKTGKVQHLLIDSNVNYKSDGSFNHTRCFIRDDTGRILRESRAEAAATAAKTLAAGKERFSSKLLHAVKTPIHAISLAISDTNSIDLPVVAAQVRELVGLITTVSKAIKFDEGYIAKPAPAAVKLSSLVREYRNIRDVRHEVVVEEIGFDASLVVLADASMLRTVLDELLRHADERSPAGASIYLSVELTINGEEAKGRGGSDDGGTHRIEFRVVDSGQELDESLVENMFHSYWLGNTGVVDNHAEHEDSGDASTPPRQRKNAVLSKQLSLSEATPGLRLNVAFNYVQCLESTLQVDSNGSRTVFKFTLDLKPSSLQEEVEELKRDDAAAVSYPRWKKILPPVSSLNSPLFPKHKPGTSFYNSAVKHILIVEDNTICQKLCRRIITNLGHTTDTADNGAIAVKMALKEDFIVYDLVLMDIRMPVMDGLKAAHSIHEKFPDLPIIALSAEEGESTREAARQDMVAFISKPTNAGGIRQIIEEHARRPLVGCLSAAHTRSLLYIYCCVCVCVLCVYVLCVCTQILDCTAFARGMSNPCGT